VPRTVNPVRTTLTLLADRAALIVEGLGVMVAGFGEANFGLPIPNDICPSDGRVTVVLN
jgi:diacylglycerol kinase (ATP)